MKQLTNRIMAVHLLNDFSGSPFVLSQSLASLASRYTVELFTATPSGKGFLSNTPGVRQHTIFYRWSRFPLVTLLLFAYSQCSLFVRLLWYLRRGDMVYINSLLPFGAALAAKLRRCPVVYHIHEVSIQPAPLKWWLLKIANATATHGIFVSKDLQARTQFKKPATVVYNALPTAFVQQATQAVSQSKGPFTVLMLCSLKRYKGVHQFLACAKELPDINFVLVLNAQQKAIDTFFRDSVLPQNLQIHTAQQNVHPFYQQASVVVNLSLPNEWIETFGMTILEAMYYKRPVLVPPVGGITELVEHGREGMQVNPLDITEICRHLMLLKTVPVIYEHCAAFAYQKALRFGADTFSAAILHLFDHIRVGQRIAR